MSVFERNTWPLCRIVRETIRNDININKNNRKEEEIKVRIKASPQYWYVTKQRGWQCVYAPKDTSSSIVWRCLFFFTVNRWISRRRCSFCVNVCHVNGDILPRADVYRLTTRKSHKNNKTGTQRLMNAGRGNLALRLSYRLAPKRPWIPELLSSPPPPLFPSQDETSSSASHTDLAFLDFECPQHFSCRG